MFSKSIEFTGQNIALFPKKLTQSTQFLKILYDIIKKSELKTERLLQYIFKLETLGFLTDVYISYFMNPSYANKLINGVDYILKLGLFDLRCFNENNLSLIINPLKLKTKNVLKLEIDLGSLKAIKDMKFQNLENLCIEEKIFFNSQHRLEIKAKNLKHVNILILHDRGGFGSAIKTLELSIDQDQYPKLHAITTNFKKVHLKLLGTKNDLIARIDPHILSTDCELPLIREIKYQNWENVNFFDKLPSLYKMEITLQSCINTLYENNYVLDSVREISSTKFSLNKLFKVFPKLTTFIYKKQWFTFDDENDENDNSTLESVIFITSKQNALENNIGEIDMHGQVYNFNREIKSILKIKSLKTIFYKDVLVYKKLNNTIEISNMFPLEELKNFLSGNKSEINIEIVGEKINDKTVYKQNLNILFDLKKACDCIKKIVLFGDIIYHENDNKIFSHFRGLFNISEKITDIFIKNEEFIIEKNLSWKVNLTAITNIIKVENLEHGFLSMKLKPLDGKNIVIHCYDIKFFLSKVVNKFENVSENNYAIFFAK